MEKQLGKILAEKNLTVACAESCTGGLLTGRLTDTPGSSAYVEGSIVSYSNRIKNSVLRVKEDTLKKFGAVSEETAREMATNVREIFKTGIGLSTTGIAGPGGGTPEKPVGLVYIGISDGKKCFVKKYNFSGTRSEIRNSTVNEIISETIKFLNEN